VHTIRFCSVVFGVTSSLAVMPKEWLSEFVCYVGDMDVYFRLIWLTRVDLLNEFVCCEQANWWQIVVPLLTEYRRLLALLFSLTNSFTASYTDVSADHCCCECEYC